MDSDFDIVFSNACIQWVPDHKNLLRNLISLVKKENEPVHRIKTELMSSEKWNKYFTESQVNYTLTQSEYYDILAEISEEFCIWEMIYYHVMKSHNDILEWYRGTGLRPVFEVLPESRKSEFENEMLENLIQRYPRQQNGDIIFRFPRFFFIAYPKK